MSAPELDLEAFAKKWGHVRLDVNQAGLARLFGEVADEALALARQERARAEAAEARVRALESCAGCCGHERMLMLAEDIAAEVRAENAALRAVAEAARAYLGIFDSDAAAGEWQALQDLRAALAALPKGNE